MRYDVAVIGTGPAGVSAAITLKIRNKNMLLLGSRDLSSKIRRAESIQNYPGIPSVSGAELSERFIKHLEQMKIEVLEEYVFAVYAMGDYFTLQTKSDTMYEASAVILSSGVSFGKLYPGEAEFLGRGVSYCATCDAPLYRGKTVAVIADSPKEEREADFLSEIAQSVYYIPLYKDAVSVKDGVEVLSDIPKSIEGTVKADRLILQQRELMVDGIFILRETVAPANLIPGIETDGNHIRVNRKMETNLKGCFACGDITGPPYQYIKAAGEGNIAALSAVEYLANCKRK